MVMLQLIMHASRPVDGLPCLLPVLLSRGLLQHQAAVTTSTVPSGNRCIVCLCLLSAAGAAAGALVQLA